jgi:branched-chain amino acid aminotransferase
MNAERGVAHAAAEGPSEASLVYLNGELVPRSEAKVSVFDGGFVLGDGVWDAFRMVRGRLAFMDLHLDRLFAGLRTIQLDPGLSREEIVAALYRTLEANGLDDEAHLRLMITRGFKRIPHQDPRLTEGGATVVIVAYRSRTDPGLSRRPLKLTTSSVRCTPPEMFDMRLNSHSRLPLILSLIEVIPTGADEALLLDPHGFVSTCNSTNLFLVRNGEVWTSRGEYCFNGITRANALKVARASGLPAFERDYTLDDLYAADEAFVTGTLIGLSPVGEVDGHRIGSAQPGPLTKRLSEAYHELLIGEGGDR